MVFSLKKKYLKIYFYALKNKLFSNFPAETVFEEEKQHLKSYLVWFMKTEITPLNDGRKKLFATWE